MEKYTSQFTGPEIDARLQEVASKYGHIEMRFDEQQTMYYMDCYATKDDIENGVDPIESVLIPISTVQGDSFTASLRTSLNSDANIVISGGKLEVPLNYRSIKISQLGNENAGFTGTLIIQTSTDGSTWNTMGEIPNVLTPREIDDQNTYQMVDIGEYLVQGRQMVRVRASYTYTNENNEEKTVTSGNVLVGNSVTKTKLELVLRTNYEMPMEAFDANEQANPFSVMYTVYGSVQKTLYLRITGSTGVVEEPLAYQLGAEIDSVNETISVNENLAYGYMTHGVKKVEAWLEAEDGLGNILKSDVLVNRFMVVNPTTPNADLSKPYLLLQNVDKEIDNFVQTEVAQYAVYSPSGESIDIAFLLTEYTEDYESQKTNEYFRLETTVAPKTAYNLRTTIEIESENEGTELQKYDTYFRVRRMSDGADTDFMYESTGEKNYYIVVDNSNAFTPVSGATFLLNPKVRNNSEENPKRILNAKNNNAEVESVWTNFGFINDGWVTAADGQKVLRVMAGSTLEIKKNIWAQFLSNPYSSLTFEIDCAINNVTNLTDPIIQMFEGTVNSFKGLKMNALEGWLMNGSNSSKNDTLFAWQEGVRTHFSINLNHQVLPNKGDVYYTAENANKANGTLSLARVLINGDCVREMTYKVDTTSEWCTKQEGSIIIGNEGADIDIYSIRIYEGKQLEMTDILNRNYLATLPTSEQKVTFKKRNNLLEAGRISLEKAKNSGLNCMVWHGVLPYHGNSAEQTGWMEYWRYDQDGNYLPEYSGTNCKETKSLKGKGQGSTAKTYYDWNLQEDNSKVDATIQVSIDKIHPEIHVGEPYTGENGKQYVDIYGGNLGKNAPIEIPANANAYEYANGKVTVPDGWIDGNGMYRGMGYRVAPDTSLAQKKVIKINYASSMQSHLVGACNTYDLLHRKVVGDTPLQEVITDAVSAKRTEPFMFFNQESNGGVYFKGMGSYGAGKADKVTWGYIKKQMPMYALIEGSDNNLPMTGFRVPFDANTAVYDVEGEGWLYNGQQSFDFDLGATDDNDIPKQEITDKWGDIHNFIYLHGTNIKYYNGTFEQFKQSDKKDDTDYKYWCTQGSDIFKLKRYDFINKEWIDAGLVVNGKYQAISLNTDSVTQKVYNDWVNGGTGNYVLLNDAFISAYVAHMRKFLKFFINEKSLQFNYCYVLGFLAGTDNSDKNTYYKIMPYAEQMEQDSEFSSWFSSNYGKSFDYSKIHQIYFDGDDMDSIFRTDNNSHQTKPYYIDRLHPYAEENTTKSLYEGMSNQLFNYVEKAYEQTHELSAVMREILNAATELVDKDDRLYGITSGKVSVWGFLHKYFFNVQHYFPQIAYLEQARIRYEFPELLGFISSGGGARNIRPITQSLGSQLQNELQYMNQRVIYMTSYAGFGAWGGDTIHSIGLSDANETFGFMPANMPDGSGATYTFTIQPHQYIYPSYYLGQTFTQTHKRTSPKETCTFTIAENLKDGGDTGIGICGINYISDLGDLRDKSVTTPVTIKGKRLTIIQATGEDRIFRPSSLIINAFNVRVFKVNPSGASLTVDLSQLIRLAEVTSRFGIYEIIFPKSSTLYFVSLRYHRRINIEYAPNLRILATDYPQYINKLSIGENVGINTSLSVQSNVESLYSNKAPLETLIVKNIGNPIDGKGWSDLDANVMEWLCEIPTCELKGTISIKEDDPYGNPKITWDLKNKINAKFGNVDRTDSFNYKGLFLSYKKKTFNPLTAKLIGNFYVEAGKTFKFELRPNSVYENSQTTISYSITKWPNSTDCRIHSDTGILTVVYLSKNYDDVVISASTIYDNGSGYVTGIVSKTIEIWNRPAQVGDLVYADGTFSSAETWEGEKTPIGICFYVPPRDNNGNILTKYANPDDKQLRLMVALEETVVPINGEKTSSLQWGAQLQSTDYTDEWNKQNALYHLDGASSMVNLTSSKGFNVYDIEAIRILTSRGMDNAYIDPLRVPQEGEAPFDYLDNSDEASFNYGFKCIASDKAMGDGFAYNESQVSFNSVGERTLTSELAKLAGSGYKEGNIVNSGYAKTLNVIAHRNALLSNNIIGANGEVIYTGGTFSAPSADGTKTEMKALGTLIDQLRNWAANKDGLNDPYPEKWQQLAYPFASACYAYQPTQDLEEGEVLADKFKAHNWFAPTEGQVARICWYAKYADKVDGSDPFKVAREKGLLRILTTSSSNHWSVTESYSYHSWDVDFGAGYAVYTSKYARMVGVAVSAF